MSALTGPTVCQPRHVQTAAERQAVYAYVTERDKTCRAPIIQGMTDYNGVEAFFMALDCSGRLERHHAGNTIGSKRITSRRTVVLVCAFHHRTWAPTHSRMILEWLARIEDAKEKA